MNFKVIALSSLLVSVCLTAPSKAAKLELAKQQNFACSISGQIYGINQQQGRSLAVVVFNPNNNQALGKFPAQPQEPGKPNYVINLQQNGNYLLRLFREESGSLFPVKTNPNQRLVDCSVGEVKNADFAIQ